jgi:hypothetical protein
LRDASGRPSEPTVEKPNPWEFGWIDAWADEVDPSIPKYGGMRAVDPA